MIELHFFTQAAKEKLLKLCYDGTADIKEFSSLLQLEGDPNIYDRVRNYMITKN